MADQRMQLVSDLIRAGEHDAARALLRKIDTPEARNWLAELDRITGGPRPAAQKRSGLSAAQILAGCGCVSVIAATLLVIAIVGSGLIVSLRATPTRPPARATSPAALATPVPVVGGATRTPAPAPTSRPAATAVSLHFEGEGTEVVGPVSFGTGVYRARVQMGTFGSIIIQRIAGECGNSFSDSDLLFTVAETEGGSEEAVFRVKECEALIEAKTGQPWTLDFEMITDA